MDKYEFNIKAEKMKKAMDRKDYLTAAKIADSLNWERSTNTKVLMMVAQIYEKQERYNEARGALTQIYNRIPVGKRVVYKLAELAVKSGDIDEALDLYREYQEIAPNDPGKLILAYKIAVARGDSLEKRISILEAYRRRDFDEKWAYELAALYQQAGKGAECVAICDEIILWFGVGPYVDRAMTLKTAYAPLTPEQEEKRIHKDLYEKRLAEVAAMSAAENAAPEEELTTTDERPDFSEETAESDFPADAPAVSPVVQEAELHMTMEQELAQSIQSTSDTLPDTPDSNEWVTDKPISVDRVGEDIDGQYTLFRTVAEENGDTTLPDHTRTFTIGAMMTKTRRLDSLRGLAELNALSQRDEADSKAEVITDKDVSSADKANVITDETADAKPEVTADTVKSAAGETAVTAGTDEAEPEGETEAAADAVDAVADTDAVKSAESKTEITSNEFQSAAESDSAAGETSPEQISMIFCHVLCLTNDGPATAQIKEAFVQAHQVSGIPGTAIARVGVDKINRAGLSAALKKLQGRDLLLEHAGELSQTVLNQLISAIEQPPCTAVILLADTANGLLTLHQKAPSLFPLPSAEIQAAAEAEKAAKAEAPENPAKAEEPENPVKTEAPESPVKTRAPGKPAKADEPEIPVKTKAPEKPARAEEPENPVSAEAPETAAKAEEPERSAETEEPDETEKSGKRRKAAALKKAEKIKKTKADALSDMEEEETDLEGQKAEPENDPALDQTPLSPDDFARFIYDYAEENDCKFDSLAELALAARLDRMELSGAPMTKASAAELVDNAIAKAERWSFKSIFVSRYDREGYLIIKESHLS